jgi:hypothetical protein
MTILFQSLKQWIINKKEKQRQKQIENIKYELEEMDRKIPLEMENFISFLLNKNYGLGTPLLNESDVLYYNREKIAKKNELRERLRKLIRRNN